jgi:hypothetical protein
MSDNSISNIPTQNLTTMLREAINSGDPNLIASVIENGIPEEAIMEISRCTELGINHPKYIIALKLMSMAECFTDEHIIDLKYRVGVNLKKFFGIETKDDEPLEEFIKYSDTIIKSLWPVQLPNDLRLITLHLINNFLNLENLFEIQPYLKKNSISIFQLICAISEMIHNYFLLLNEFYKSESISKQLLFPPEVAWCFDNPDNPIEKNISLYVQKHTESLINDEFGVSINLSIEKYHQFVKEIFDFDKIISTIKKNYYFDQMESIIKTLNTKSHYLITKDQIISLIVYDFAIENSFVNYSL